ARLARAPRARDLDPPLANAARGAARQHLGAGGRCRRRDAGVTPLPTGAGFALLALAFVLPVVQLIVWARDPSGRGRASSFMTLLGDTPRGCIPRPWYAPQRGRHRWA